MKKLLGILSALIIILAGCSSSADTVANTGDGKLVIWSFFEGPPKMALDEFEEATGSEVEFVTIGYGDFQTKLNTVIGTDDQPDIVALERGFVGTYLGSDNFVNFSDIAGIDQEKLTAYKENTSTPTAGPGIVDEEVKALSWGVNSSAFFYRSDLASQCLGIESVEEMEAATQSLEDYYNLNEQLKQSSDATCSNMSLFSSPDYYTGLLQQAGMYQVDTDNKTYTIPAEFSDILDTIKANNDSGLVYSPQDDKTQITSGNSNDAILGNLSLAWATQVAEEYQQPGQWAIADTPLDFSAGGTYLAVTNTADQDLVSEYLNMTFLNEDWYIENMDTFNIIGNEEVMSKYFDEHDGSNEYYGGQNSALKLVEIDQQVDSYDEPTLYDSGIGTALDEVVTAYTVDGTIKTTDEAKQALSDKITSTYPELTVEIE